MSSLEFDWAIEHKTHNRIITNQKVKLLIIFKLTKMHILSASICCHNDISSESAIMATIKNFVKTTLCISWETIASETPEIHSF